MAMIEKMTFDQAQLEKQKSLHGYDNPTLQSDITSTQPAPSYTETVVKFSISQELSRKVVTPHNNNEKAALEDYDPYQHRDVKHPTTYSDTLIHMLKASLGTGILAMPNAFHNAGYVLGIIGTFLIGFMCTYSMHIVVKSHYELCKRKRVPSLSYPGIAEAAFSEGPERMRWLTPVGQPICRAFLIMYQIGISCCYVVFMASNLKAVCDNYWGEQDVRMYMLYIFIPLILICWVRNLKLLAPFSTVANIATTISFGITFYYIFTDVPSMKDRHAFNDVKRWPLFFGTVLFAMEAIGVIMPLENEMEEPKRFNNIFGVLNVSMIPITTLYALVGLFGYIKFGEAAKGSITLNLPNDEKLAQSVKLMLAVSMYVTYALSQYVAFDIIWNNIIEQKMMNSKKKIFYEYVVRTCIVIVTFVLAVAIPNLELFISLIGALCLSTIGIAMPAIIQMLTFWDSYHGLQKKILIVKNFGMILIAILGFVIGVSTSLSEIMHKIFHINNIL